jgi:hypothetical protein
MDDPWKFLAFIVAGVTAGFLSILTTSSFSSMLGVPELYARIIVTGATGLFAGFFVDEMLPAYIKHVRGGSGGMGGDDFGGGDDLGGGDDDFDL